MSARINESNYMFVDESGFPTSMWGRQQFSGSSFRKFPADQPASLQELPEMPPARRTALKLVTACALRAKELCSARFCQCVFHKIVCSTSAQFGKHSGIFRWFEELGPICELLEKVIKIEVIEIKSPVGIDFQKYVYSSFMVKVKINLGPFGLFWFILGWG